MRADLWVPSRETMVFLHFAYAIFRANYLSFFISKSGNLFIFYYAYFEHGAKNQ